MKIKNHNKYDDRLLGVGRTRGARGFSLVELMITLVILIIIASLAVPNYIKNMERMRRSEAMDSLLRIAAEQEKHFLQNNAYAAELADFDNDFPAASDNGYYTLALDTHASGYEAKATATGVQLKDETCREFVLDGSGARTAIDSKGDPTELCWG